MVVGQDWFLLKPLLSWFLTSRSERHPVPVPSQIQILVPSLLPVLVPTQTLFTVPSHTPVPIRSDLKLTNGPIWIRERV